MENELIKQAAEFTKNLKQAKKELHAICEEQAKTEACYYHDKELGHTECFYLDALEDKSNFNPAIKAGMDKINLIYADTCRHGLTSHDVDIYSSDYASGVINSGEGEKHVESIQIFCNNRASLREVFNFLYPEGPHESIHVGSACIYSSWYFYTRDGGKYTEIIKQEKDYLLAAYAVGINPLPYFRNKGYKAEYWNSNVSLQRNGLEPITITVNGWAADSAGNIK